MIFSLVLPSLKGISVIQLHLCNGFAALYDKHGKTSSRNLCEHMARSGTLIQGTGKLSAKGLVCYLRPPAPYIPSHPVLVKLHPSCKLLIIIINLTVSNYY